MLSEPIAALPLSAQLHEDSPPSARVCELLASSHGFLGKWGEVTRLSLLSLDIDPGFYHAHYTLGVAANGSQDLPQVFPNSRSTWYGVFSWGLPFS